MEALEPQEQETTAEALTDDEIQTLRQSAEGCPNIESERIEVRGREVTVHLQGELTERVPLQQLGNILVGLAVHPKVRRLVIELGKIEPLCNTITAGVFARVARAIRNRKGECFFLGAPQAILEVFQITKLSMCFGVFLNREQMEQQLEKGSRATVSTVRKTPGDRVKS